MHGNNLDSLWSGALLLASIIALLLYFYGALSIYQKQAHYLNLDRLEESKLTNKVVALGTSRGHSSLLFDQDFDRLINRDTPLQFVRIMRGNGNFDNLFTALDKLLEHPPRLLLVEDQLLAINKNYRVSARDKLTRSLQEAFSRLGLEPAIQISGDMRENHSPEHFYPHCEGREFGPAERQRYHQVNKGWVVADAEFYNHYLEYFDQLQEQGTTIVLLDIPLSPLAIPYPDYFQENLDRVKAKLAATQHYLRWQLTQGQVEHYCDGAHASKKGQDYFSHQLADRIIRWYRHSN